jgi:hypothetical protein
MDRKDHIHRELAEVFGGLGTGTVLTKPSTISDEVVEKLVCELPLKQALKDLGAVAAREVANAIETVALRPADYADLPDLPEKLAERLVAALEGKGLECFVESFVEHLRNRG